MKHKRPRREAGLIQHAAKLASPQDGVKAMNPMQFPTDARQWLTPDHQAVLATIARWAGEPDADSAREEILTLDPEEQS